MHMGGVTYPTLPLQEAVPRPQSGYGQHSVACSPAGSFTGSLPPQPHSAYFSGMTGPQHPFYNRVRQDKEYCWDNLYSTLGKCVDKLKLNQVNAVQYLLYMKQNWKPSPLSNSDSRNSSSHFCLCLPGFTSYDFHFYFYLLFLPIPSFSPHSLISPIMCITCQGITPTMPPHLCVPPLNHLVNLRTAPMDL